MTGEKTVILSGASRGIGHATVMRFGEAGWRVITCSRESVPDECLVGAVRHQHIVADLADADSIEAFVAEANELLGDAPLNGLVNNAGVSPKADFKERLGCLNADLDDWRVVFELNFFAPLMLSRGFAAALHRGYRLTALPPYFARHATPPPQHPDANGRAVRAADARAGDAVRLRADGQGLRPYRQLPHVPDGRPAAALAGRQRV